VEDYKACGYGLLEQAVGEGSALACLVLADHAYHDMKDSGRKEKAYGFIEKGLSAFPAAGEDLWIYAALLRYKGNALLSGLGVLADPQRGRELLQEAVNRGDEEAQNILIQTAYEVESTSAVLLEDFDPDQRIAELVGWDRPKKLYEQIHKMASQQMAMGLGMGALSPHFILSGPPGTGKNIFIDIITRKLHNIGYLTAPKYTVCDLMDPLTAHLRNMNIDNPPLVIQDYINEAKGGLLVIKDSRKRDNSDSYADSQALEQWVAKQIYLALSDPASGTLVCLYQEEEGGDFEMDRLLRKYSDLARCIRLRGQFESFQSADILEILRRRFEGIGVGFAGHLEALATQEIQRRIEQGNLLSVNAHIVVDMVFESLLKESLREQAQPGMFDISTDTLPLGSWHQAKDVATILSPLNALVGLESVKEDISNLTYLLKAQKERAAKNKTVRPIPAPHFIFTGPPGTGKTTVARMMGKMFHELGYLSRGHVVETDATSMVGKFMGQTAPIVRELMDRADGGILFIDEAYSLGQPTDGSYRDLYREEAVASLLKLIEDRRGRVVVIAAGYSREMHNFTESNSGIKSRFSHMIDFDSFSPDQLVQIFINMCANESMSVSPEAIEKLKNRVKQFRTSDQITEFGNARGVRNIFEKTIGYQARRVLEQGDGDETLLNKIEAADLPFGRPLSARATPAQLADSLEPLNKMVGLKKIKDEIERLSYVAQSQMIRERAGLPAVPLVLHSLFTGPPGTGKTTVARLFGKILADLGYLTKGHVVEVDQSNMIGSWLGQTPQIVRQQVNLAEGGILFIDEAYALGGHAGSGANYGQDAIGTLLKLMEDRRDRFVVIAAGYTKEMDEFIKINSGLQSRFPNHLVFESYSHPEMLQILSSYAAEFGLTLTPDAEQKVCTYLDNQDKEALDALGNGRLMRNIFEKTIGTQAKRILQADLPPEEFKIIRVEDITFPKQPDAKRIEGFLRAVES